MNTKHLKAKILDLAIRGKLVEQKAEDGNAFDLLQKIREEKGKMKNEKSASVRDEQQACHAELVSASNSRETLKQIQGDISENEIPFEIPENWCWCRLGEITTVKSSKRVFEKDYVKNGVPFYRSLEIGQLSKSGKCTETLFITRNHYEVLKKTNEMPTKGDILITSVGSIGNTWICDDREFYYKDGNVTQISKSDAFEPQFINFFLHSNSMYSQVSKTVGGSAYNALTIEKLKKLLIPLPPLPEQKRIVSAIEKAFEHIDIIEKNKLNLKTYIKQTKSKVLDLAIRGKLVEQNPQEGNAFDLLQKIRAEKMSHRLDFANAKSRKNKQQTETALAVSNPCDNKNVSDVPFEIPENWCWCRFNDLFTHTSGKALKKSDTTGTLRRYITTSNLYWDKFVFNEVRTMYFKDEELEKCTAKKGDLLICNGGDVGRAAIWNYDYDICIQNHISRLRRIDDSIVIRYFFFLIWFYKNKGFMTGKGIGISSLTVNDIMNLPIPLPPLPEQKRIVTKIEQVFEQLDVLEKSLGE